MSVDLASAAGDEDGPGLIVWVAGASDDEQAAANNANAASVVAQSFLVLLNKVGRISVNKTATGAMI